MFIWSQNHSLGVYDDYGRFDLKYKSISSQLVANIGKLD